ncbi:1857_t:CDS:2, partial [Ambispora leptoticha]
SNGDNSPQIPPRPPQHNPFSEHNLSKGIPDDARERYEEVFEAKKSSDGYIDDERLKGNPVPDMLPRGLLL